MYLNEVIVPMNSNYKQVMYFVGIKFYLKTRLENLKY